MITPGAPPFVVTVSSCFEQMGSCLNYESILWLATTIRLTLQLFPLQCHTKLDIWLVTNEPIDPQAWSRFQKHRKKEGTTSMITMFLSSEFGCNRLTQLPEINAFNKQNPSLHVI